MAQRLRDAPELEAKACLVMVPKNVPGEPGKITYLDVLFLIPLGGLSRGIPSLIHLLHQVLARLEEGKPCRFDVNFLRCARIPAHVAGTGIVSALTSTSTSIPPSLLTPFAKR